MLATASILATLLLACSSPPPVIVSVPQDPAVVTQGRTLVKGLAACGYCHGERGTPDSLLTGGLSSFDKYGEVLAPNVTPAESGLAEWTTYEVLQAIRFAKGRGDDQLSLEVHKGFEWLSDEDSLAIVAYLRTLAPVENRVERRSLSIIERNTTGFFDKARNVPGYVPAIDRRHGVAYGKYLVDNVARCHWCHSSPGSLTASEEYLAGGKLIRRGDRDVLAPGITGALIDGIGEWNEEQIVRFLQTGQTPQGRTIDTGFCPIPFYQNADPADLRAIADYLRTVPAAG